MDDQQNVEGAQDPAVSSRVKDELFAEPPRKATSRKKPTPKVEFQEPVVPENNDPQEHAHTAHEEEASDATVENADFEAEEQNKKGGDA